MNIKNIKNSVLFTDAINKVHALKKKVERYKTFKDNCPFNLYDCFEDALNPQNLCIKRFYLFIGYGYGNIQRKSVFSIFNTYEYNFLIDKPTEKIYPELLNMNRVTQFKFIDNNNYIAVKFESHHNNTLLQPLSVSDDIILAAFNYHKITNINFNDNEDPEEHIENNNSFISPNSLTTGNGLAISNTNTVTTSYFNKYDNDIYNVQNKIKELENYIKQNI